MKPTIKLEEKVTVKGQEVTITGEVYDEPIKELSRSSHGPVFSKISLSCPDAIMDVNLLPFPARLSENELQFEMDYIKNKIQEKPELYGFKLITDEHSN